MGVIIADTKRITRMRIERKHIKADSPGKTFEPNADPDLICSNQQSGRNDININPEKCLCGCLIPIYMNVASTPYSITFREVTIRPGTKVP